jgi:hypothetical protein
MESLCPVPDLLDSPAAATDRARGRLRIVFLSGEPHTPGHSYRVERYAAAARDLGHEVGLEAAAQGPDGPRHDRSPVGKGLAEQCRVRVADQRKEAAAMALGVPE